MPQSSTRAAPLLVPTARTLHTSVSRATPKPVPTTEAGSSSSGSKSKQNGGPLSITNIFIATAAIVIATPHALELYGKLSGRTPSRLPSFGGKLEPYTHNPLPLATSSYYPDPSTASAHKLLQIALPSPAAAVASDSADDLRKKLRIRSVYIKEPSLVIERAYTPLYDTLPGSFSAALAGASPRERQLLDLIVKRYRDGELGRMLHRAVPNPTVPQLEVRGPVDTWSLERDHAGASVPQRIVLLVGGTGVTPAYQLLTNLFGRPGASVPRAGGGAVPKVEVLYAVPDVANALLLPQLHALATANPNVSVALYAEHLPSPSALTPADTAALGNLTASSAGGSQRSWIPFWNKGSSLDPKLQLAQPASTPTHIPVFESRITQQHLAKILPTPPSKVEVEGEMGRTLVLVCGPDAMVEALAGPKSRDGQTQGALAGILARMGLRREDVFKL